MALVRQTSAALRRELSARALVHGDVREESFGSGRSIVFAPTDDGGHGNFLPASYKRICADAEWARRLEKTYTAEAQMPRRFDRRRGELECASSSDALLMNVFCYPGITSRPAFCSLLNVERGLRPRFGVRAMLPMRDGEIDRTEIDMAVGNLFVEAKLTETGFQTASFERVKRYDGVTDAFDLQALPRGGSNARAGRQSSVLGYQALRGILAADRNGGEFLLLCDGRRADLIELWFRVLGAVRRADLRSRARLLTWQEVAATTPPALKKFLAQKYGIVG